MIGAAGVVTLDGGPGEDTIYANGAQQAAGGADDDQLFGDAVPELGTEAAAPLEAALVPFVEKLGIQAVEDAVERAGAEMASSSGSAGNQAVFTGYSVFAAEPIEGDELSNNLWGSSGNDTMYGYDGDDRLFGGIGDDVLRGGDGNDLLSGGQGGDNLNGQEGRFGYKSVDGPSCDNHGGKRGALDGFESLEGSAMADWLVGDIEANTLMGRPGEDLLSAGPGADSIRARNDDDDIIYCGTGVDGGLADPLPLDDQEYDCDDKLERG